VQYIDDSIINQNVRIPPNPSRVIQEAEEEDESYMDFSEDLYSEHAGIPLPI